MSHKKWLESFGYDPVIERHKHVHHEVQVRMVINGKVERFEHHSTDYKPDEWVYMAVYQELDKQGKLPEYVYKERERYHKTWHDGKLC